jgi:YggT family protein
VRQLICTLLLVYWLILVLRIVISWFPVTDGPVRRIYELLFAVTEPVLRPFRGLLPPVRAGGAAIDLSPLVVFVLLVILQRIVC